MDTPPLDETDEYNRELNITTSKNFIGYARVKVSSLDFIEGREIDGRIVRGLVELFEKTQCRRYDADNYIKAWIHPHQLKSVLRRSKLTKNALKSASQDGKFPFLHTKPTQKFICYDGRHRTKAAEQFFQDPDDHWWTVKLHLKRPEDNFTSEWKDQYYHQSSFSAGEIYRKVWFYRRRNDSKQVDRWMQRLTRSRRVGLRQLLKREDFTTAFEGLLPFPGPWAGLQLGNIQRHFSAHFDEEWLRYVYHIVDILNQITLNQKRFQAAFDIQTMEELQCRAPASCIDDRDFVISAMKTGLLFSKITNKDDRKLLKKSILRIKCLIPSIKSMHENLKLLDIGAKLIKDQILGNASKRTLHDSLYAHWRKTTNIFIETSHGRIAPVGLDEETCWKLVYKQIWIAVLRDFAELGDRQPRKEAGQRPYPKVQIPSLQYRLAKFVSDLGIKTPKIEKRLAHDPRRETLRLSVAQLYATRSQKCQEKLVEKMLEELPACVEIQGAPRSKMPDTGSPSNDRERRWGVTFQNAYRIGKRSFFLPEILNVKPGKRDQTLTVLFILRDFVSAFLGLTEEFRTVPIEEDEARLGREVEDDAASEGDLQDDAEMDDFDSASRRTSTDASLVVFDELPTNSTNQVITSVTIFDTQPRSAKHVFLTRDPSPSVHTIEVGTQDSHLSSSLPFPISDKTTTITPQSLNDATGGPVNSDPLDFPMAWEEQSSSIKEMFNDVDGDSPGRPAISATEERVASGETMIERVSSLSIPRERPRSPLDLPTSIWRDQIERFPPASSNQTTDQRRSFTLPQTQPQVASEGTLADARASPVEHMFERDSFAKQMRSPILSILSSEGITQTTPHALQIEPEISLTPFLEPQTLPTAQVYEYESSTEQPRSPIASISSSEGSITPKFRQARKLIRPRQLSTLSTGVRDVVSGQRVGNETPITLDQSPISSFLSSEGSITPTIRQYPLEEPQGRFANLLESSIPSGKSQEFLASQESRNDSPTELARFPIQSTTTSPEIPVVANSVVEVSSNSLGEIGLVPEPRTLELGLEMSDASIAIDFRRWSDFNFQSRQSTFSLPPSLPRTAMSSDQNTEERVSVERRNSLLMEYPLSWNKATPRVSLDTSQWLENSKVFNLPPDPPRSTAPSLRDFDSVSMVGLQEVQEAIPVLIDLAPGNQMSQINTPQDIDVMSNAVSESDLSWGSMSLAPDVNVSEVVAREVHYPGPDSVNTTAKTDILLGQANIEIVTGVVRDEEAEDIEITMHSDGVSSSIVEDLQQYQHLGSSISMQHSTTTIDSTRSAGAFFTGTPIAAQAPLRFFEFDGVKIRKMLNTPASMATHLDRRKEFVMFELEPKRKVFRVIHKGKVLQTMIKYPEKKYCLVKREWAEWWRKQGAKRMADGTMTDIFLRSKYKVGKPEPTAAQTRVRQKTFKQVTGRAFVTKYQADQSAPIFATLLGASISVNFQPSLSILDCEKEFTDSIRELYQDQSAFMCQLNSEDRTLWTFKKSQQPSKAVIQAIDAEYTCFAVIHHLSIISSVTKVAICVAQGWPVWLVPKAEVLRFKNNREARSSVVQIINKSVMPAHPETQLDIGREEELFESDEESTIGSIHLQSPTSTQLMPSRFAEQARTISYNGPLNAVETPKDGKLFVVGGRPQEYRPERTFSFRDNFSSAKSSNSDDTTSSKATQDKAEKSQASLYKSGLIAMRSDSIPDKDEDCPRTIQESPKAIARSEEQIEELRQEKEFSIIATSQVRADLGHQSGEEEIAAKTVQEARLEQRREALAESRKGYKIQEMIGKLQVGLKRPYEEISNQNVGESVKRLRSHNIGPQSRDEEIATEVVQEAGLVLNSEQSMGDGAESRKRYGIQGMVEKLGLKRP